MNIYKGVGLFASGVLFGSAGFKLLSSKDAKKAYTHATAAALRVKESVTVSITDSFTRGSAGKGVRDGDGHLCPGKCR